MRPVSGQFLWGSDFPFIAPERCLAELDALDLPADVLDKLLRENALRILGALRREVASRGAPAGVAEPPFGSSRRAAERWLSPRFR